MDQLPQISLDVLGPFFFRFPKAAGWERKNKKVQVRFRDL